MMSADDNNGTKLDLSKLTDDEARHVWQVIKRDFNLRKKEEVRLGDLKSKIVKEDTKRELLGHQASLNDSLCIHCLHPFKFLLNSKRQCLDCKVFVCKDCGCFNIKENGWVCNPCQMARVLRIGTLEWFHENLRARFKHFGSVKVMSSLYKRLNEVQAFSQTDLRVHSSLYRQEDNHLEDPRGQQHRLATELNKRMLIIEILLSQLENKILRQPLDQEDQAVSVKELLSSMDLEELELRKKLEELTDNISDIGLSSDEEEANKMSAYMNPITISFGKQSFNTQRKQRSCDVSAIVNCELSQLERKLAMAAASIQRAQIRVSDIQNRIVALCAIRTMETPKMASIASERRRSIGCPKASNGTRMLRKLSIV